VSGRLHCHPTMIGHHESHDSFHLLQKENKATKLHLIGNASRKSHVRLIGIFCMALMNALPWWLSVHCKSSLRRSNSDCPESRDSRIWLPYWATTNREQHEELVIRACSKSGNDILESPLQLTRSLGRITEAMSPEKTRDNIS
jgi:hypothetical protein